MTFKHVPPPPGDLDPVSSMYYAKLAAAVLEERGVLQEKDIGKILQLLQAVREVRRFMRKFESKLEHSMLAKTSVNHNISRIAEGTEKHFGMSLDELRELGIEVPQEIEI
jgi:dsDNA-specific endonuclease/ATPase MutS2